MSTFKDPSSFYPQPDQLEDLNLAAESLRTPAADAPGSSTPSQKVVGGVPSTFDPIGSFEDLGFVNFRGQAWEKAEEPKPADPKADQSPPTVGRWGRESYGS